MPSKTKTHSIRSNSSFEFSQYQILHYIENIEIQKKHSILAENRPLQYESQFQFRSPQLKNFSQQKNFQSDSSNQQKQSLGNNFLIGSHCIPHQEKQKSGGEDFNFSDRNLISVIDGVGGWKNEQVNPQVYPKKLCENIRETYFAKNDKYLDYPKQLLIESAYKTQEKGSATVCIASLSQRSDLLYTSHMGDSGYLILRPEQNQNLLEIVFKSQDQCYAFNYPFQIGTNGEHPRFALSNKHQVKNNDIIVVGSDGLFDNLSIQQISDCILPFLTRLTNNLNFVAEIIAKKAFNMSISNEKQTPFQIKAKKQGIKHNGGKQDDITVVIGLIQLQLS